MEAINQDDLVRADIALKLRTKQLTRMEAEQQLRQLGDPLARFREWRNANPEVYGQALRAYQPPAQQQVQPQQRVQRAQPPRIGEVQEGYRFRGGNPGDPKNWEPAQ